MPSRRVSCSAMRPRNETSTRSSAPGSRPWASRPSFSHSGTNGRERLHRLRADRVDVHRVGDDAAGERGLHLAGGVDAGAILSLRGGGAEVRRDDDVVALEQRVRGERLLGEDVEGDAGELARLEPALDGVEVDERAAGAVDDPRAVAHLRDRLVVDHPVVSGVFGTCSVIRSARA